jgi:hypothetical protein
VELTTTLANQALTTRLSRRGIDVRMARNGALGALGGRSAASVLAVLLGMHINTAVRWSATREATGPSTSQPGRPNKARPGKRGMCMIGMTPLHQYDLVHANAFRTLNDAKPR